MKKEYQKATVEIIEINNKTDIITTSSSFSLDEDELPLENDD